MRIVGWVLKFVVFVLLVGFAVKNTDPVVVRFYLGYEWTLAPRVRDPRLLCGWCGVWTAVQRAVRFPPPA